MAPAQPHGRTAMLTDRDDRPIVRAEDIRTVGVIGAGQMGGGIAQTLATHGFTVRITDQDRESLDAGLDRTRRNLDRAVERGRLDAADRDAALDRIHGTADFTPFGDCDVVVEAATEDEAVKRRVLKAVVPHLKPDAVIVTNTSSISITRLASVTDRPSRFMGMHFMNPVPVMKLVELIRGITTEERTFEVVCAFARMLDKTPAVAEDFPAFIVNRILMPMLNEAVYVLYEGVGDVASIDTAMKLGANHPMGPLELADFIGLDTCLAVMHVLYEGLADSKYRPCPLLVKYCEAGWYGRKAGRGFYDYTGDEPVPTR